MKKCQPLSRKTLEAGFYIIALFLLCLSIFLIHNRLLDVEKIRCQTWHWSVCDQVLAER